MKRCEVSVWEIVIQTPKIRWMCISRVVQKEFNEGGNPLFCEKLLITPKISFMSKVILLLPEHAEYYLKCTCTELTKLQKNILIL